MSQVVTLDLEFGGLQEPIHRHKSWKYIMDLQQRRVTDSSLGPRNLKPDGHTVSLLHSLKRVTNGQRALPDLINDLLVLRIQLAKIQTFDKSARFFL